MRYKNCFEVGEKLEIQTADDYIGKDENLISQLLEIISEEEFLIAIPIHNKNLVPIPIGNKVLVYYSVDSKGVFYFTAKVIDRKNDRIPYLKIQQVSETKIIQRRDYFRLQISISMQIYNLENEMIEEVYTKDISGGGMRFISNKKLDLNEEIYCKINIEEENYIIKSKVIRSDIYESNMKQFDIGIRFLEIDEKTKNSIIGYIFKQQRILRQKGLI